MVRMSTGLRIMIAVLVICAGAVTVWTAMRGNDHPVQDALVASTQADTVAVVTIAEPVVIATTLPVATTVRIAQTTTATVSTTPPPQHGRTAPSSTTTSSTTAPPTTSSTDLSAGTTVVTSTSSTVLDSIAPEADCREITGAGATW